MQCRASAMCSYVILLEVAHVADDSDPHEHGSCSEEDAADVVACDDLAEAGSTFTKLKVLQLAWICLYRRVPYSGSLF